MSARARRRLGAALCAVSAVIIALPGVAQTHAPKQARRIAHGHELAQAKCSSCHAVENQGASPNRRSPPFRTLSGRFVELTLMRRLTEISETGHYDMPEVPVHTDEVRAIVAYINSLPPADADRSPPSSRP